MFKQTFACVFIDFPINLASSSKAISWKFDEGWERKGNFIQK